MRPSKTPPERHHRTYSRSDLLICPTLTTNGPINAKDQLILDQNLLYRLSSSSIPLLLVFPRSFSSFSACLIESPPPVWEQPGALIMWCSLPDIDLCRPPPSPSPLLCPPHTPLPLSLSLHVEKWLRPCADIMQSIAAAGAVWNLLLSWSHLFLTVCMWSFICDCAVWPCICIVSWLVSLCIHRACVNMHALVVWRR